FSSRRRHTRFSRDWSSDVCSSDLGEDYAEIIIQAHAQMSRVAESAAGPLSVGLASQSAPPLESDGGESHAMLLARQLRASFEQRSEERRVGKECAAGG